MKPRTLVVIVALLSLCSCALLAYGGLDERSFKGRFNPAAPSFDQLRRMFTARLKTSEMRMLTGSQDCILSSAHLDVLENGACAYAIQPDANNSRQLSLVLGGDGAAIDLKLTQPNALSIEQTLKTGERIDLDIYRSSSSSSPVLSVQNCQVDKPANNPDPNRLFFCSLEIKN